MCFLAAKEKKLSDWGPSGMLHVDIREDNILVTERSVRLIDFGFSADSSSNEDYMKSVNS